ncbi:MAG: cytochrome c biogenesis protein CcsA [Ignavibacteriales bacterium]|nr:cytochrome c biogenesis protein CcsA [Ignavibacteriales bacterium]
MIWKIILFVLMVFVAIAGISFPIVEHPTAWYQFPIIPGLEEKAKIIFFHVPTAWLTVVAFFVSLIYGIRYLKNRNMDDDAKAYAAAQIGIIFCILATVTGSIWAKFNWGTFWNWDPRETSIFILLLIYGAFFALRSAIEQEDKKATLSSVYLIISFLTVPFFIFIMPRIMIGLHPGSLEIDAATGKIVKSASPVVDFKMNANMRLVFFTSLFAFTILFFWMWVLNYKSIIFKDKLEQKAVG